MNMPLRVIARMLKTGIVPASIGIIVGISFNVLTVNQLFIVLMVGLITGVLTMLYRITQNNIETEDNLKSTSENN